MNKKRREAAKFMLEADSEVGWLMAVDLGLSDIWYQRLIGRVLRSLYRLIEERASEGDLYGPL